MSFLKFSDDDSAGRSEARRLEISADWFDATEVAALIGKKPDEVAALRHEGRIYAAWLPSQQRYLYPRWQFNELGSPIPEVAALLSLLRSGGPDARLPSTGWGETEWFVTCHALLDGFSPAEVLVSDPARVLAVAQDEFSEPRDSG